MLKKDMLPPRHVTLTVTTSYVHKLRKYTLSCIRLNLPQLSDGGSLQYGREVITPDVHIIFGCETEEIIGGESPF